VPILSEEQLDAAIEAEVIGAITLDTSIIDKFGRDFGHPMLRNRNVSTTLIQPGLEFKLGCLVLVQWLFGLVARLPLSQARGRPRSERLSCLFSA
jgi:hypothetical protein